MQLILLLTWCLFLQTSPYPAAAGGAYDVEGTASRNVSICSNGCVMIVPPNGGHPYPDCKHAFSFQVDQCIEGVGQATNKSIPFTSYKAARIADAFAIHFFNGTTCQAADLVAISTQCAPTECSRFSIKLQETYYTAFWVSGPSVEPSPGKHDGNDDFPMWAIVVLAALGAVFVSAVIAVAAFFTVRARRRNQYHTLDGRVQAVP